jgi:hypothetical protein
MDSLLGKPRQPGAFFCSLVDLRVRQFTVEFIVHMDRE